MLVAVLLGLAVAATDGDGPARTRLGGVAIPLVGANSTDGFGVGFGGELYTRDPAADFGYDLKLTFQAYATVTGNYTNNFVRFDRRGERGDVTGTLGYMAWRNLLYAGDGGEDVVVDWGDREGGNRARALVGSVALSRPLADPTWKAFAQVAGQALRAWPAPDGLLEADAPYAQEGGGLVDVAAGVVRDTTDRWPLALRGGLVEVDARVGVTVPRAGDPEALFGFRVEACHWWSVPSDRFTLGARAIVARTAGRVPFFDQNRTTGRWRDEIGYEQMLSGYGRTRTRGDGVLAAAIEGRGVFGRWSRARLEFLASAYAEIGWLPVDSELGPILPTVGLGPEIAFQGALQLRPYVAVGWRSDAPGAPRRPDLQYGISFLDPL